MEAEANAAERHVLHFTVDGKPFTTHEHELTPRQIMTLAGIDPATHFLTLVEGREQTSYRNKPDVEIHMHNNMVFVTASTGPTPVS